MCHSACRVFHSTLCRVFHCAIRSGSGLTWKLARTSKGHLQASPVRGACPAMNAWSASLASASRSGSLIRKAVPRMGVVIQSGIIRCACVWWGMGCGSGQWAEGSGQRAEGRCVRALEIMSVRSCRQCKASGDGSGRAGSPCVDDKHECSYCAVHISVQQWGSRNSSRKSTRNRCQRLTTSGDIVMLSVHVRRHRRINVGTLTSSLSLSW